MHIAFAYRSGEIEFGTGQAPEGAIVIATSRGSTGERMRERISARARHAYDGKTLLVPGIPEAESDHAAMQALDRFIRFAAPTRADRKAEAA